VKSSQVRDLARRYAAGQLSQENYRSQRRSFIDSVAVGTQPLVYKESAVRLPGKRARVKLMAVAAAAILLAVVALKLLWKTTHTAHKTPANAPTAFVPPPLPAPGPDLVRTFVETNDWSDGSLEDLSHRWVGLTAEDQGKARDSLMYPRLEAGLRQQITSEKAVAGSLGGQDVHLVELTKVAKQLGIPATP